MWGEASPSVSGCASCTADLDGDNEPALTCYCCSSVTLRVQCAAPYNMAETGMRCDPHGGETSPSYWSVRPAVKSIRRRKRRTRSVMQNIRALAGRPCAALIETFPDEQLCGAGSGDHNIKAEDTEGEECSAARAPVER